MNISTNLKAIDMIKGEILSEIAHLYRTLADYDEIGDYESVTNEIATVIAMVTYLQDGWESVMQA